MRNRFSNSSYLNLLIIAFFLLVSVTAIAQKKPGKRQPAGPTKKADTEKLTFTRKARAGDLIPTQFKPVPSAVIGEWQGRFPCKDCPGLDFTLVLYPDYTFRSSTVELESMGRPMESVGNFNLQSDSVITLLHKGMPLHQILILNNMLYVFSSVGKPMEPFSPTGYALTKSEFQMTGQSPYADSAKTLPEYSRWELVSFNTIGAKYQKEVGVYAVVPIRDHYLIAKTPTLTLDLSENRARGFAGCNNFSCRFVKENNFLTFGYLVFQQLPCEEYGLEIDYLNCLDRSPFQYEYLRNQLILRNSGGLIIMFKRIPDSE